MKFFFDRCMPIRIARIVSAYEAIHTARHLDDDMRFHARTPDTEWIATLAEDDPGWVVISGDSRILRDSIEREALRAAVSIFLHEQGLDEHEVPRVCVEVHQSLA